MADNPKVFVVYKENEHVFVFKFSHLTTAAAQAWGAYILKYDGQYPSPLRLLYDFSDCKDAPSRFFLKHMQNIIPQLTIPKDVRYAYLLPNQSYTVWANAFFNPTVERGQSRSFLQREEALEWLMQGLTNLF